MSQYPIWFQFCFILMPLIYITAVLFNTMINVNNSTVGDEYMRGPIRLNGEK